MGCENLCSLLERLGQRLGVNLDLGEDNYCVLTLDDSFDLTLEYEAESESLLLTADCGTIPPHQLKSTMQQLLEANFYGTGTGGGFLSLNGKTGVVYLQHRVPTLHLDEERLQIVLQAFVDKAEEWTERLEKAADASPEDDLGDDEGTPPPGASNASTAHFPNLPAPYIIHA